MVSASGSAAEYHVRDLVYSRYRLAHRTAVLAVTTSIRLAVPEENGITDRLLYMIRWPAKLYKYTAVCVVINGSTVSRWDTPSRFNV